MSAKRDDISRIHEIYSVIEETQGQMRRLAFAKDRFLQPQGDADDLISEGILNRVLRITEEAGSVSREVASRYGFDQAGVRGVRNRLAHAYGDVDREIIWEVIQSDFPALLKACRRYCDDEGIELP